MVVNDEPFVAEADPATLAEYGLPPELTGDDEADDAARAERRRRVVPLMVAWAEGAGLPAPDPERLDQVLDRQYVPAETGFFALLDALGIRPAPERPVAGVAEVPALLPEPEQEAVDLWVLDRSGPRFAFQVDTYADLFTRLDAVTGWLTRLRETFPGQATVSTVSVQQRYRDLDADDRSWQRVLRDVGEGQVRVSVPGTGSFEVELRSPLVNEPTGPLPNGYPAYFVVQVDRPAAAGTPELLATCCARPPPPSTPCRASSPPTPTSSTTPTSTAPPG